MPVSSSQMCGLARSRCACYGRRSASPQGDPQLHRQQMQPLSADEMQTPEIPAFVGAQRAHGPGPAPRELTLSGAPRVANIHAEHLCFSTRHLPL
eukprot:scaffold346_cov387-Prasinococcus_capsulatus_cf.AAC.23